MSKDLLNYNTVLIECPIPNNMVSKGTGFFIRYSINNNDHDLLITNKHVVKDAKEICVHFKSRFTLQGSILITFSPNNIINHPDENIDLCGIFISPELSRINQASQGNIRYEPITENRFYNGYELKPTENILMRGFPGGYYDKSNVLPISMKGITALNPNYDYEGKPDILIQCETIGGASGSPIYLADELESVDCNGNHIKYVNGELYSKFQLLGIVKQSLNRYNPIVLENNTNLNLQIGNLKLLSSETYGIGIAIKVSQLKGIKNKLMEQLNSLDNQ